MNLKILPKFQWYRRIKALFTYQSVVSNRLDANTAEIFMLRQNVDRLLNEIQLMRNDFYQWSQRPFELDIEKKVVSINVCFGCINCSICAMSREEHLYASGVKTMEAIACSTNFVRV